MLFGDGLQRRRLAVATVATAGLVAGAFAVYRSRYGGRKGKRKRGLQRFATSAVPADPEKPRKLLKRAVRALSASQSASVASSISITTRGQTWLLDCAELVTYDEADPMSSLKECIQIGFHAVRRHPQHEGWHQLTRRDARVRFRARCAGCFKSLRDTWNATDEFWKALCEQPLRGGDIEKSGKSGALFWFSGDRQFVLKTLSPGEFASLAAFLDDYRGHFVEHADSLLCRFHGAFEMDVDGDWLLFVVMNNTFHGDVFPDVIYDLKGTSEDRWVCPSPGAVLKDLNFADKLIGLVDSDTVGSLIRCIENDARFLESHQLMDYSLLLGVAYLSDDAAGRAHDNPRSLAKLYGFEPRSKSCTLVRGEHARPVLYYIGIIDLLQEYTFKKIAAHVIKSWSLGWLHEIDTEPPDRYANRFTSFFKTKIDSYSAPDANDAVSAFKEKVLRMEAEAPGECTRIFPKIPVEEAIDFMMRQGARFFFVDSTSGLFRTRLVEVEAFLDPERYAFTFRRAKALRESSSISVYNVLAVLPTLLNQHESDRIDRVCHACKGEEKVEMPSPAARRFTIKASGCPDIKIEALSRRQMKLCVTALEAMSNLERFDQIQATSSISTECGCIDFVGGSPSMRQSKPAHRRPNYNKTTPDGISISDTHDLANMYITALRINQQWEDRFFRRMFVFVKCPDRLTEATAGRLSIQDLEQSWFDMNIDPRRAKECSRCFYEVAGFSDTIDETGFKTMWSKMDIAMATAVRDIVKEVGAQNDAITAEQLQLFFEKQGEHASLETVQRLLNYLSPPDVVGNPPGLTARGFARLLCCPENNIVNLHRSMLVQQDMTRPLTEYWISSSHNTYLEGNQLSGRSSVLQYAEVLHRGCRCVEVDVWDGPDGEPRVTHGYTATSAVLFQDVINCINDHAFDTSAYPLIISLEQQCQQTSQIMLQSDMIETAFGDKLLRPPVDDETGEILWSKAVPPSPQEAMYKIILKAPVCSCQRCKRELTKYNRLIFMPTMKLKHQGTEINQFLHTGGVTSGRCQMHCSSFSEAKVDRWIEHELVEHGSLWRVNRWHLQYLSRSYPDALRVTSSNANPMPSWQAGIQMVALNYQTADHAMLMQEALFECVNQSCGYRLKSRRSRGQAAILKGEQKMSKVRVHLISGHRLPKPASVVFTRTKLALGSSLSASSPYVVISLTTTEGREERRSHVIHRNGFDPFFDFAAEFVVPGVGDPDLCFLAFEIIDKGLGEPMCHAALPLREVRQGYRWVQLNRPIGGLRVKAAGLLVKIDIESETL